MVKEIVKLIIPRNLYIDKEYYCSGSYQYGCTLSETSLRMNQIRCLCFVLLIFISYALFIISYSEIRYEPVIIVDGLSTAVNMKDPKFDFREEEIYNTNCRSNIVLN